MTIIVKVRLEGLPDHVGLMADRLRRQFKVVHESKDYQNNGRYIRRYITIQEQEKNERQTVGN